MTQKYTESSSLTPCVCNAFLIVTERHRIPGVLTTVDLLVTIRSAWMGRKYDTTVLQDEIEIVGCKF
jgi:hypothetical protein